MRIKQHKKDMTVKNENLLLTVLKGKRSLHLRLVKHNLFSQTIYNYSTGHI